MRLELFIMAIPNGILSYITLLLAFYASYKDSSDMQDLADNGVWRLTYRVASTLGFLLYKVERMLWKFGMFLLEIPIKFALSKNTNEVSEAFISIRRNSKVYQAVAMLWSAFLSYQALQIILSVYDMFLGFLFQVDGVDTIAKFMVDNSSYQLFNSITALFNIIASITGIVSFFVIIVKILIFIGFHILFFSVLFGFLEHRVRVYDLSEPFKQLKMKSLPENSGTAVKFVAMIKNWWYETTADNPVLLPMTYRIGNVGIGFGCYLLGILISFGSNILDSNWGDIVFGLLDAVDLVNIIMSFIIAWVMAKGIAMIGREAGKYLPEDVQNKLHEFAEKCKEFEHKIKTSRDAWARMKDDEFFCKEQNERFSSKPEIAGDIIKPNAPKEPMRNIVLKLALTEDEIKARDKELRDIVTSYGYDPDIYGNPDRFQEAVRLDRERYDIELENYRKSLETYNQAVREKREIEGRWFMCN